MSTQELLDSILAAREKIRTARATNARLREELKGLSLRLQDLRYDILRINALLDSLAALLEVQSD